MWRVCVCLVCGDAWPPRGGRARPAPCPATRVLRAEAWGRKHWGVVLLNNHVKKDGQTDFTKGLHLTPKNSF